MANKTVYPFGTDGSLPASVGIINDLITGGADKALSAQQGKIIGDYLFTIWNTVDLSALTVSNRSLGNQNPDNWTTTTAKHIACPVTPGDKIRITVTSSQTNGGFYAFFSNYDVPASSSSNVYYVGSSGRIWLTIPSGQESKTEEMTVPEGAAYLIMCTKDGSGHSSVWTLEIFVHERQIDNDFIPTDNIADNLVTDDAEKVLSARQGVVLDEKIEKVSPSIPSGLTPVDYTGELVHIRSRNHKVAKEQVATITSINCQGGACYGDYLFMFNTNNTTCWIYNLRTSQLLQTYTIPAEERGFVSNSHCNTVNFGTEKYDADDPFPLVYVSTGYASGGDTGALVYRIVATTVDDVTTYSLSLVQTLKLPGTGWTEFIVGEDGNCFLCYTGTRTIYRMVMPKLSDGDLTFDLSDALEVYQFTPQPASWNGSRNQNRMYYDGKIYFVSGVPSTEKRLFVVLDLATRTREVAIDFTTLGLNGEPETCFVWDGKMCVVFLNNSSVYALYFE